MNILITGASGFIGSYLTKHIGGSITGVDRDEIDLDNRRQMYNLIHIIDEHMGGCDTIIHCAGLADNRYSSSHLTEQFADNVLATHNLMETALDCGVKNIIHLSTACVYGYYPNYFHTQRMSNVPYYINEEDYMEPISIYGTTKMLGEQIVRNYSKEYGLNATILRLGNIVGEGYKHGVIYDFFNKLNKSPHAMEILGDGQQTKQYLDVYDLSRVIQSFVDKPETVTLNVANINGIPVTEVAQIVADAMGLSPKFTYTGGESGWKGDSPVTHLDVSKMCRRGFTPHLTSSGAVRKTIKELINNANK